MGWEEDLQEDAGNMAEIIEAINLEHHDLKQEIEDKRKELDDAIQALYDFEDDNRELLFI